jgi:hypothetical protein
VRARKASPGRRRRAAGAERARSAGTAPRGGIVAPTGAPDAALEADLQRLTAAVRPSPSRPSPEHRPSAAVLPGFDVRPADCRKLVQAFAERGPTAIGPCSSSACGAPAVGWPAPCGAAAPSRIRASRR